MTIDQTVLTASLDRLATVAERHGDVSDALQEVVSAAAEVFAFDGTAFMIVDDDGNLIPATASGERGRLLEEAEAGLGEGPCFAAFAENSIVPCADVQTDDRFPRLGQAVAPLGIRAVLGVPVRVGGGTVGVLDLFSDNAHEWTDAEIASLRAYAGVIEQLFTTALALRRADEVARQLQFALDYRVVIERAIGYLMCRDGLDAVAAFDRLRRWSRSNRRKVADVAAEVVRGRVLD